jgi:hypothetical protein
VLGVGGDQPLVSIVDYVNGRPIRVPWPSDDAATASAMSVPLLFIGRSIHAQELSSDLGLDQIAPTLEPILGLHRPHPEVRSGQAIPGVVPTSTLAPLVVLIVWKGVGTPDVGATRTPWLDRRARSESTNAASGSASARSLPLDPAAVETTIGTGALPSQHGVTGTWLRGDNGRIDLAYGRGAPVPVVASLGDDLDRATHGAAKIGLIQGRPEDVGLTGDAWYGTGPVRDRTVRHGADIAADVTGFLRNGWGDDAIPDLLAVPLSGLPAHDDRATSEIVDAVLAAVPGATIVVAGTGSLRTGPAALPAEPIGVVATAGGSPSGGFFVDRQPGSTTTAQDVVDVMRGQTTSTGAPVYADAFASYAVRFGRYC